MTSESQASRGLMFHRRKPEMSCNPLRLAPVGASAPEAQTAAVNGSGGPQVAVRVGRHLVALSAADLERTLARASAVLSLCGGRLTLHDHRLDRALRALVAACTSTSVGHSTGRRASLAVPAPDAARELLEIDLEANTLRKPTVSPALPRVTLRLRMASPEAPDPVITLRLRLSVTAAEANCALALADGCSIDQTAARLGISRNTVRAHIRSLYVKTGTHRQAALVALVHRSLGAGPAHLSIAQRRIDLEHEPEQRRTVG